LAQKFDKATDTLDFCCVERRGNQIILKEEEFALLVHEIEELKKEVKELKAQLGKNSSNSSKPPSSDGYKKQIKNNRGKSDKKQGAQEGHEGTTLQMVATPDKVVKHKVKGVCGCGRDLNRATFKTVQARQVFDLVEKLVEVTEHQVEVRQCSCGMVHEAECTVKGNAQYGARIKALMVYLNQYQYLPFERLQEFSQDCLGLSISDGLLATSNQLCHENLEQTEMDIKQQIIQSEVMHNDETGIRCEKKTQWIHSSSTKLHTHYSIQNKRGKEGMDAIGILAVFKGISVHDRWASYDDYDCAHALCNAHLLRDLKFLAEETGSKWAEKMIALLVKANQYKKEGLLDMKAIQAVEKQSNRIIKEGLKQEPPPTATTIIKRGRKAKTKSLLLLQVFIHRSQQVWAFLYNEAIPFDNNLAERDLRMVKLKQKISGCFRSINGAQVFCRIRSYISTARKQGYGILHAIEYALLGNPISL
jgi:transposase